MEDRVLGEDITSAKILIADDDPLCRRLVAGVLRQQKFKHLHFADCGMATLEQVRTVRPDLVLLDMQMPDINGLDVCGQLRADRAFADIPILLQTATVDRKKMGELFSGGASDFLSKPVTPSELIARVVMHLERWNSLRELRGYRERISRELEAARRMQFELLPEPAALQEAARAAGLRIASYNRSSSELGGDIWGILPIDDAAFGLFLADFTGHGVDAALNTFRLHALIHEYKGLHDDPGALVSMLNERLIPLLGTGQFATFLYVVIDHRGGELRLASAGAPPAILVQGKAARARLCDTSSLPLGIERGVQYRTTKRNFPAESLLLLFSDGLPEFPDMRGRRIGDDGLVAALNACHRGLAPRAVIDHLCAAAGITESSPLPDDTTIVCLDRRSGTRAALRQDGRVTRERAARQPSTGSPCEGR
ncbi:SpoIIE family protein phosphatase [Bradyrhizobium oligotrophicum]|uniref:SpoIIE family protein phosphatase n=1 Tax=Bradyrhizobium oligotrophicum TaxID=44255 RepID=UPI003EBF8816